MQITMPCYRCEEEVDEQKGIWRDGIFYCEKCYGKETPVYIQGMGPDAPTTEDGLESALPYDMTLIPPEFLFCLSALLKEGADKYGEGNWKRLSYRTNINHAICHILTDLAGDDREEHLINATARLLFAWWLKKEEKTHDKSM